MSETSTPLPPRRRFLPTPVEETVKKSRKFAVEPVETTTRSSKKENKVEEIEDATARQDSAAPSKKRFLPQPVETTFKSNKPKPVQDLPPTPALTPVPKSEAPCTADPPAPRRKFTPQLIETSKRSKRATTPGPATLPTDKTDITPGTNHIYIERKRRSARPLPVPLVPDNTPRSSSANIHDSPISILRPRRQPSMRPHLNTRQSTRQNSYQTPDLDTIASSESSSDDACEGTSTPALSDSFETSEESIVKLNMARTRESCDERFSGYLLALAAKAAEKQLREQALAAFPNESAYEIVEHFYDREVDTASEDGSVVGIGMLVDDAHIQELRKDSAEVGWAVKEMQQHQENLNRQREEETNKKLAAEASAPTFKDPFWTNGMTDKIRPSGTPADKQKEAELARMRSAASPPMLGSDLKFRMCPSPKATKFESDQRHDVQPHRVEDGGGLWGGYCVAEEAGEYLSPAVVTGPSLIQTPQTEREDPFSAAFSGGAGAKSPKRASGGGIHMLSGIDTRLKAEVAKSKAEGMLLQEFNDTFVTQVYNYLSLGYPSIARQYDEELARISRISEEELRIDDKTNNVKGHIGLVAVNGGVEEKEGKSIDGERSEGGYGARWKALRIYILEWARQHPSLSNGSSAPGAWGVRARRGSWAI